MGTDDAALPEASGDQPEKFDPQPGLNALNLDTGLPRGNTARKLVPMEMLDPMEIAERLWRETRDKTVGFDFSAPVQPTLQWNLGKNIFHVVGTDPTMAKRSLDWEPGFTESGNS